LGVGEEGGGGGLKIPRQKEGGQKNFFRRLSFVSFLSSSIARRSASSRETFSSGPGAGGKDSGGCSEVFSERGRDSPRENSRWYR